ncbi:MAG: hypothetical protein EBW40_06115, partial [Gammaproteobacteria bacterium]|nr:hypothetical protein [Gammaproteobacteria bacterium]
MWFETPRGLGHDAGGDGVAGGVELLVLRRNDAQTREDHHGRDQHVQQGHARLQAEAAIASGYPLFGICLGHQLLALTAGLDVFKMYVGHRGANHPVQNLQTGRVEVTTQNHGFAVDPDSLKASIATLTHVNLNDRSVEG